MSVRGSKSFIKNNQKTLEKLTEKSTLDFTLDSCENTVEGKEHAKDIFFNVTKPKQGKKSA